MTDDRTIDSILPGKFVEFDLGWKPDSVVAMLYKEFPSAQGRITVTVTKDVVRIKNCSSKIVTGLHVLSKAK